MPPSPAALSLSDTDSMASAMPGMCEDRPEDAFPAVFAILATPPARVPRRRRRSKAARPGDTSNVTAMAAAAWTGKV